MHPWLWLTVQNNTEQSRRTPSMCIKNLNARPIFPCKPRPTVWSIIHDKLVEYHAFRSSVTKRVWKEPQIYQAFSLLGVAEHGFEGRSARILKARQRLCTEENRRSSSGSRNTCRVSVCCAFALDRLTAFLQKKTTKKTLFGASLPRSTSELGNPASIIRWKISLPSSLRGRLKCSSKDVTKSSRFGTLPTWILRLEI